MDENNGIVLLEYVPKGELNKWGFPKRSEGWKFVGYSIEFKQSKWLKMG